MEDKDNPTGALALPEAHVNTEFSAQTNILAKMEEGLKGHDVLINQDSPSGTLERDSKNSPRKKSPVKQNNMDSVDGFQRFGEVSKICFEFILRISR